MIVNTLLSLAEIGYSLFFEDGSGQSILRIFRELQIASNIDRILESLIMVTFHLSIKDIIFVKTFFWNTHYSNLFKYIFLLFVYRSFLQKCAKLTLKLKLSIHILPLTALTPLTFKRQLWISVRRSTFIT